jgi:hypothetical protein
MFTDIRARYTPGGFPAMVNLDEVIDLSIIIQPVQSEVVLDNLRKKVSQLRGRDSRSIPKKAAYATLKNKRRS